MEETLLSQVSFSALDIHSASVIIILLAIGLTFFSTQQYCNTAKIERVLIVWVHVQDCK